MSVSLLAPLFLAGLGLMIVPWLIHRIQRPERRPVRFSSLLFIPQMDKEVVQRRRLQHLLLLLLRMAVLALLAFAFSRPFLPSATVAVAEAPAARAHVVLIDRSFSMGTNGWINEARTRARDVLNSLPETEPVAIVAFDETAEVLLPLPGEGDGDRPRAAELLDEIEVSQLGTSFPAALLEAKSLLEAAGIDGTTRRGVVHLISDLQQVGFGANASESWRLPPGINVRPIAVGEEAAPNRGVVDVAVRPIREGAFRVSAKVKNWTMDGEAHFPVTLHIAGREQATQEISVLRHHASQVSFDLKGEEASSLQGWIEIEADAIETDNRRYFVWNPPPRRTIAVVTRNRGAEAWPSGWFAQTALNSGGDSAWEVVSLPAEEASAQLDSGVLVPDVVIAGELDGADTDLNRAILEFLQVGGQAILTLAAAAEAANLNSGLLSPLGLHAQRRPAPEEQQGSSYRLMSWIDFDHPIFQAFQAPQFNDFSSIRIFDHVALDFSNSDSVRPRALIQLEDGEGGNDAALVEVSHGAGRALVWSFPHDPRVTNLPKSARFAPIILESVRYLTDAGEDRSEIRVGAAVPPGIESPEVDLQTADGRTRRLRSAEAGPGVVIVNESGLLHGAGGGSEDRTLAVNPNPAEGNPLRMSPEAFRLRVMPPENSVSQAGTETPLPVGGGRSLRGPGHELGLILLFAVAGLLFVELWYAPRLVR